MKSLILLVLVAFASEAFAKDCGAGAFIVYAGSCTDQTAKVYVRGDRSPKILKKHYVADEGDGTVQCAFTGDYVLTVVETGSSKSKFQLSGCR